MSNDSLFLKVLTPGVRSNDIPRPPIWFMRQAGRALASYRSLKEKYSFAELLRDPTLATEVTLLPKKALGVDALILFSDILVIPEAMGVEVDYERGGPRMLIPLKDRGGNLPQEKNSQILYSVYETITTIKKKRNGVTLDRVLWRPSHCIPLSLPR